MATSSFSNILTEDGRDRPTLRGSMSYPCVDETQLQRCSREISDLEIKEAMFSMGGLKYSGPNPILPEPMEYGLHIRLQLCEVSIF